MMVSESIPLKNLEPLEFTQLPNDEGSIATYEEEQ